jgi:hypothetical protein
MSINDSLEEFRQPCDPFGRSVGVRHTRQVASLSGMIDGRQRTRDIVRDQSRLVKRTWRMYLKSFRFQDGVGIDNDFHGAYFWSREGCADNWAAFADNLCGVVQADFPNRFCLVRG